MRRGWEAQAIPGSAGVKLYDAEPRKEGDAPASARTEKGGSAAIREWRERELCMEAVLATMDPLAPRHRQAERVLVAARKVRKRLEREAKDGR